MRNSIIILTIILISTCVIGQELSFKFFDAQTGKAIQPQSLTLQNELNRYVINEEELHTNKLLKNNAQEGEYNLYIDALGYKPMHSKINIKKSQSHNRSFYLRNLNPPENINVDYVRSLHNPEGAIIVGYIVDDQGTAVNQAEIISSDGERTMTDEEGYFQLFLNIKDKTKGFAIKSLTILKPHFKTDVKEKIVVFPNGDYIYKFIMENGEGTTSTTMSDIIVENGLMTGRHKDTNQPYFESTEIDDKASKSLNCNDIPNSITIGYSSLSNTMSSCQNFCPFTITIDFETYVSESLDNEWLNLWSSLTNIENAYRAGAVAIRSFAGWRVVEASRPNYNITNNTFDQAWSPGTTTWALAAQTATEGSVLKSSSSGRFISTNYAAETNNLGRGPCGNGRFENSIVANQCFSDAVTAGYPNLGHEWNMGQWQSARWATGLDLAQNYGNNVGSPHGLGTRSWQWIVDHYYPSHSLFNCNGGGGTLDCSNAISLTCGVTYSGPSSGAASAVGTYGCNNWTESGPERVHKIISPGDGTLTATLSNFTGDLDVYILGSCNPFDCLGTVSSSSATFTNAVAGQTYYIVVDADDGSGSGYDLLVTCPPPSGLNCSQAVTLTCGVTYTGPSSGATSNVETYGCNNWTESGPERVHEITPLGNGTITATLSNFSGDLDVYILGSCNPFDCLGTVSSSSASFTNAIAGQTYYIVVDADDGSGSGYDLLVSCPPPAGLDCSQAVTLTCGVTYSGPSSGASSQVESYACNTWTESGPERVHKVTATGNGTLTATLSNFTGDLDVYILGSCDPDDCLGTVSSQSASFNNAIAGQTYYIVVDADDGSGSGYNLIVNCPPPAGLDCSQAVALSCGNNYFGPSSNAASLVDSYACNNWTETGPERVHKVTPTASGTLTATISNFAGDLDVYILGSCDPNNCLGTVSASSASYSNAIAGQTYYIVVDADDGSGSSYNLVVDCPIAPPNCPPTMTVNPPIISGVYQAYIQVMAQSVINTGSTVTFEGGNNVLLNAGFEVRSGAVFEAVIENCQN